MYYVYMIRCEDNSLYTGYTTDVVRRFKQHCEGKGAKYTRSHKPLKVVLVKEFKDKSSALKEECRIKKLRKSEKEYLVLVERFSSSRELIATIKFNGCSCKDCKLYQFNYCVLACSTSPDTGCCLFSI